eukprot:1962406-Amphidinium_carterae.1
MELSRVMFDILTKPSGVKLVEVALDVATRFPDQAAPFWKSWIDWVSSSGGVICQGGVRLEGKLLLHHALNRALWKHETRRFLALSAIHLAARMDRKLEDFHIPAWDVFISHHVLCTSSESHGAETFACGGVNCRDRNHRHCGDTSLFCEHGCEQADTPSHKLFECKATEDLRTSVKWSQEDDELLRCSPFPSLHYGMCQIPDEWVKDLDYSAVSIVDFAFISKVGALASAGSLYSSLPSLSVWTSLFPDRHRAASAAV